MQQKFDFFNLDLHICLENATKYHPTVQNVTKFRKFMFTAIQNDDSHVIMLEHMS